MADETTIEEATQEATRGAPPETGGRKRRRRLEAAAAEVAARQGPSAKSMGWQVIFNGEVDPRELIMREDLNGRHYSDDVSDLVLSLLEDGQKSPICLRRSKIDGSYEVIFGNRRTRAGLEILDAKLKDDFQLRYELVDVNDEQAYYGNVIENHRRRELSDIDYAHIIERLKGYGRTQGDIAKQLGRSDSWVSRALSLLKLSEKEQRMVHDYVMSGGKEGLSPAAAYELIDRPVEEREQEVEQLLADPEPETLSSTGKRKTRRVTREAVRKRREKENEEKPFAKVKARSTREIREPFEAIVEAAKLDTEREEMTVLETVCSYVAEFCAGKIGQRAMLNGLERLLG